PPGGRIDQRHQGGRRRARRARRRHGASGPGRPVRRACRPRAISTPLSRPRFARPVPSTTRRAGSARPSGRGRRALRLTQPHLGRLASAINGTAVARKTSVVKERLGERLFRPGIHVLDDPHRLRGLRSRPFDAEGVATRRLAVVEDGVLASWLLDSATARELGFASTGHAQRGVSSTPAPGPSNLHLAAGSDTPEPSIADIAEGFYVTDLIGVGVNQVTGDYSRGASGFWIENGKRSYPVSEVTIAGNLIEMFQ